MEIFLVRLRFIGEETPWTIMVRKDSCWCYLKRVSTKVVVVEVGLKGLCEYLSLDTLLFSRKMWTILTIMIKLIIFQMRFCKKGKEANLICWFKTSKVHVITLHSITIKDTVLLYDRFYYISRFTIVQD